MPSTAHMVDRSTEPVSQSHLPGWRVAHTCAVPARRTIGPRPGAGSAAQHVGSVGRAVPDNGQRASAAVWLCAVPVCAAQLGGAPCVAETRSVAPVSRSQSGGCVPGRHGDRVATDPRLYVRMYCLRAETRLPSCTDARRPPPPASILHRHGHESTPGQTPTIGRGPGSVCAGPWLGAVVGRETDLVCLHARGGSCGTAPWCFCCLL